MARLILSEEEQRKVDSVLKHFGANHPEVKQVFERVESFEIPDVLRFVHAAIRLRIETRLAIPSLVERARELGMEPSPQGLEDFEQDADIQSWALHTNFPDTFLDRFDIPVRTSAEWAQIREWLRLQGRPLDDMDLAASALGLDPEPGSNLFYDLLGEILNEAEEMFFDDMSEKIRKELLGS